MFGVGPMELVIILALALIVLGPQKFPEAGRMVGKALREFRSVTDDLTQELRSSFDDEPPEPRRVPENTVSSEPGDDDAVEVSTAESAELRPSLDDEGAAPPDENQPGPV